MKYVISVGVAADRPLSKKEINKHVASVRARFKRANFFGQLDKAVFVPDTGRTGIDVTVIPAQ